MIQPVAAATEIQSGEAPGFRSRALLCVILLTGVAAVLRFLNAGGLVLVGDEFGTVTWIRAPVGTLLTTYERQLTMHLYVLLVKAWSQAAGDSALSLKMPTILAGIAMVPLAYAVCSRWFDREAGLIAALFLALCPILIKYARFARVYTLLALLVLASMALYGLALRTRRIWPLVLLGLVNAAALACSLTTVWLYGVQALHALLLPWLVGERSRSWWRRLGWTFALSVTAGVLFYSGMLPDMIRFFRSWSGGERFRVDWVASTFSRYFWLVEWPALAALILGAVAVWRRSRAWGALVVLWAVLPWLFFVASESRHPEEAFRRLLIPTLPALAMVISVGVLDAFRLVLRGQSATLALLPAAALVAAGFLGPRDYFWRVSRIWGRPYPSVLEALAATGGPKDVLIQGFLGNDRIDELALPPDGPAYRSELDLIEDLPPSQGRFFALADHVPAALESWSHSFDCQVFDDPRYSEALVLLCGPPGTAGGDLVHLALERFMNGYVRAAAVGSLHEVPRRHFTRLAHAHEVLGRLARHRGQNSLARSHRERMLELQKKAQQAGEARR